MYPQPQTRINTCHTLLTVLVSALEECITCTYGSITRSEESLLLRSASPTETEPTSSSMSIRTFFKSTNTTTRQVDWVDYNDTSGIASLQVPLGAYQRVSPLPRRHFVPHLSTVETLVGRNTTKELPAQCLIFWSVPIFFNF